MRPRIAGFVSSACKIGLFGLLVTIATLCGLSKRVDAQWTQIHAFPGKVATAIYFLDHQGIFGTGFVGFSNRTVIRTTDNGTIWLPTVPPSWNAGTFVGAFAFADMVNGWCSLGPSPPPTNGTVWNTTDGGQNWAAQSPTIGFNSYIYNYAPHRAICTSFGGTGNTTVDGGANWVQNQISPGKTGMAWSDSLTGVMACDTSSFMRTVDGGATWIPVPSMKVPCWVPYGVPGTKTFFCVSQVDTRVYRSDDGGATWAPIYKFNQTPTGDIEGINDTLFVQTTTDGFYESTDQGVTWMHMCGPSNPVKTRFYICRGNIYAAEPGKLWFLPNAASAGVHPTPASLSQNVMIYNSYKCGTFDSVLKFDYIGGCVLKVDSVKLTGSPNFRLGQVGTGNVFGTDSIHVLYSMSLVKRDTARIHVYYTVNAKSYDTLIMLYAIPTTHISVAWNIPQLGYTFPNGCHPIDTALGLKNLSCDTLEITAADVLNATGFQLGNITFPIIVLPGDSTKIPVHVGTHYIGDYYTGLHLHYRSQLVDADTVFPLYLTISKTPWPALKPMAVTIKDRCKAFDTAITIKNTFCDVISLDSLSMNDSSAFQLLKPAFPALIAAGDSLKLILHLDPTRKGVVTAIVTALLHAGKDTLDTTIKVTLTTQNDIQPALTFNTAKLNFGATSECVPKDAWLKLVNPVCRPMVITSIKFTSKDSAFSMETIPLPDTLWQGINDSLAIHFRPKGSGPEAGTMVIHIEVDGVGRDTLIQLIGTAFQSVTAELAESTLDLDTVSSCSPKSGSTTLTNLSCDSVEVTSAIFGSQNGYALTGLALPRWLKTGDSLTLNITLDPSGSGNIDNSVDIRIHPRDPNGTEVSRVLQLHAFVVKGAAKLGVENDVLRADSLAPCTTFDTTITITNLSNCDTALLSSLAMTGSGAVVLSGVPQLPAPAGPGKSLTFHLQITPVRDSLFVNKIHLVGVGLDTIITVYVTASHSNTTVLNLLQNDPHFRVRLCQTGLKTIGFQSAGCDLIAVDTAYIEGIAGQSQFTVDTSLVFPIALAGGQKINVPVRFNPGGTGDSTVRLHVLTNGKTLDHVLTLTGGVVGAPISTHLGMTASNGSLITSTTAEGIITTSLRTSEDLADTLGLTTITTHIRLNSDVLSYIAATATPDWNLIANVEDAPGQRKLSLQRVTTVSIPAGSEIVSISFKAEITDTNESSVRVVDARYNETDPNFESCVAAPLIAQDQLVVQVNNACGNATLRKMMQGTLVDFLGLYPNPVSGLNEVTLQFASRGEADLNISISDATGILVRPASLVHVPVGKSSWPVSIGALRSGAYFLTVEESRVRKIKPLLIER